MTRTQRSRSVRDSTMKSDNASCAWSVVEACKVELGLHGPMVAAQLACEICAETRPHERLLVLEFLSRIPRVRVRVVAVLRRFEHVRARRQGVMRHRRRLLSRDGRFVRGRQPLHVRERLGKIEVAIGVLRRGDRTLGARALRRLAAGVGFGRCACAAE
jgi:hypothetical protein